MLTRRERFRKAVKSTANRLRRLPGARIPVLVFGEQRSGTNMLIECFDACPTAEVFNETDEGAFDAYELRDLDVIRRLVRDSTASHVVFKPTADGNRAGEILAGLPGARAVWIYRAYEDAVNSALEKWHQHNEYLRLVLEEPIAARWRAWNLTPADLDLLRRHYLRRVSDESARALIWYLRNTFYFRCGFHERDDVLLLNYEHLVREPQRYLRLAFEHCGLAFRDRYHDDVKTTSIGRLERPPVDAEIAALCDELKARLDATFAARTQER